MASVGIGIRMVTSFRAITSRMRRGERENIIFMKAGYSSPSSTLIPAKSRQSISRTDQHTQGSNTTVHARAVGRQFTSTRVITKDNGKMTKNTATGYSNTSTAQNTTVNGKTTSAQATVHIPTQMVTNTKAIGNKTSNKAWEHIITSTVTFTKVNGEMANQIVKEIISIKVVRLFIKVIGIKVKKKVLVSWLFRIIMGILGIGRIIRKMARVVIFIQMVRNMMVIGLGIRSQVLAPISIKMVICTLAHGRMIGGQGRGR